MQTFSIAVGEYEGFVFRVNPVDTSIVELTYYADHIDGDLEDGEHMVIAQFKRNGGLSAVTRVPVARTHEVVRDSLTGTPSIKVMSDDEKAQADAAAQVNLDSQGGVRPGDRGTGDHVS